MTSEFLILTLATLTTTSCSYLSLGSSGYLRVTEKECQERHYVQYGNTCLRVCPPKTHFYPDDNRCYDSCPLHSIQIGGTCLNSTYCQQQDQVLVNGSCENECPSDLPFTKEGYCYQKCSKESVQNGTECISVSKCINNSFIFNDVCVRRCPFNTTYSVRGRCQETCPDATVINGNTTECLPMSVCKNEAMLAYNKTCVQFCPQEAPYDANGECFETCPKSFVPVNSTNCISNSDCMVKGWLVFNGTCVSGCPTDTYQYYINDVHECSASCPKGFVIHGEQSCINETECTDVRRLYSVIYNGSCLPGCPLEAPLINKGHCTDTCPETTFEADSVCFDNNLCSDHFDLEYNGKCVRSCPKEAPRRQVRRFFPDRCIQCPYGEVEYDMKCVPATECTSKHKYVYRKTCYDSCPEDTYSYTDFQCYVKCPKDTVVNDSKCIPGKECQLIFNDSCVSTCPLNRRFVHNNICLEKCPRDTIANHSKCIPRKECQLIFNESCVSTCPLNRRFVHNNICLEQCPRDTFSNGTVCIGLSMCPGFVYNGTCVDECPDSSPLVDDKHCVAKCPAGYKAFRDRNCVLLSKCKKFPNGTIIESNATCVTACPSTGPYTYKFEDICFTKCPSDTLVQGVNCIATYECDGVEYEGRCMSSCPSEAPYKYIEKCYSECPENTFRKGQECSIYTDCPNIIFNKTCIHKGDCPTEAKYRKDNTCLKVCPDVVDVDGITCIYQYECTSKGHFITDEQACVVACPPGHGYAGSSCMKQRYVTAGIIIVPILSLATYAMLYLLLHNPTDEARHQNAGYIQIGNVDDTDDITGSDVRPRRREASTNLEMELDDLRTSIEVHRLDPRDIEGRPVLDRSLQASVEVHRLDPRDIEGRPVLDRCAISEARGHQSVLSAALFIEEDERPQPEADLQANVEVHRQDSREVTQAAHDFDDDDLLFGDGVTHDSVMN